MRPICGCTARELKLILERSHGYHLWLSSCCRQGRAVLKKEGETSAVCALPRMMSNKELGARKIRLNLLDPGITETEGWRASGMDRDSVREHQEKEPRLAGSLQWDVPLLKV